MNTILNDTECVNVTGLSDSLVFAYECEGYDNRLLGVAEIKKFFHKHDVLNSDLPESTEGWTLFDMLAFLGY